MGIWAWLALVVCVVGGGAGVLAWARRVGVARAAAVGLALQGTLTLALYLALGLSAPDAGAYDELGRQFAAHWAGGPEPDAVGEGKEAFPVMLGAIYYVVGPAPAIGLALNWVAFGLLVVALAALAARLDLPARLTAWAVAIFPATLLWSAQLLREVITWLLMTIFLYALVGLARRVGARDLVVMVVSLASLLWFRGTAAVIIAGVGTAVLVLTARRSSLLPRLGVAALALAVLAPRLSTLLAGNTNVSDFQAKRADLNNAGTSFNAGDPEPEPDPGATPDAGTGDVNGDAAADLLDAALRMAFGPFPWEWSDLPAPFAFDGVMWLFVLGMAVVGWWCAPNRKDLLLVVLPALAISAALTLAMGNYGTMQRLRVQTSVLLLPVAAAGFVVVLAALRARSSGIDRLAAGVSRVGTDQSRRRTYSSS